MGGQRRERSEGPAASSAGTATLAEWVISRADADAIAAFETRRTPVHGGHGVTPVTEALAYLGAALAIAAGGTVLGGEWDGLSTAGRIAVSGTIWLVLLCAGWYMRGATSPPRVRLAVFCGPFRSPRSPGP